MIEATLEAEAASVAAPAEKIAPEDIRAALDFVSDPEIPGVSIIELGMIGDIEVARDGIRVELLPTFVGCPALEVIRESIETRLAGFGRSVVVDVSFATPWSSDRISPEGRAKLQRSGFAPPPALRAGRALPMLDAPSPATTQAAIPEPAVACPYCGSARTTLDSAFGPTQCRSIRHCADCRQPFEAFKPI